MFSGIIADLGVIVDRSPRGNGCTLLIQTGFPVGGDDGIQLGDSIACNGVCLTIVKIDKKIIYFYISVETIRRSSLAIAMPSTAVSLVT